MAEIVCPRIADGNHTRRPVLVATRGIENGEKLPHTFSGNLNQSDRAFDQQELLSSSTQRNDDEPTEQH